MIGLVDVTVFSHDEEAFPHPPSFPFPPLPTIVIINNVYVYQLTTTAPTTTATTTTITLCGR